MKRLPLALLLLLAAAAPAAIADPVAVPAKTVVTAPNWVIGSNWYYSDGYALKVTSTSQSGATTFDRLDAPGQWFTRQGFLRKDLTSGTATRNSVFRTIPDASGLSLSAGTPLTFQREYLQNGKLMVHASSWTVEGRETITVPAGTFDCFIIVWRTRSLRSDWTGFERWWYSPQAQNYVRMEYKYGPDSEGSRVLMRYQIGAPVAGAAPAATDTARAADTTTTAAPPAPVPAVVVEAAPEREKRPAPAPKIPPVEAAPIPVKPVADPAPVPAPAPVKASKRQSHAPQKTAAAGVQNFVWHAQVASSKEEAAVRKSLDKILRTQTALLQNAPSGISAAPIDGRGVFYRAWVGYFERSADAVVLCGRLRTAGQACSVSKSPREDARMGRAGSAAHERG